MRACVSALIALLVANKPAMRASRSVLILLLESKIASMRACVSVLIADSFTAILSILLVSAVSKLLPLI